MSTRCVAGPPFSSATSGCVGGSRERDEEGMPEPEVVRSRRIPTNPGGLD